MATECHLRFEPMSDLKHRSATGQTVQMDREVFRRVSERNSKLVHDGETEGFTAIQSGSLVNANPEDRESPGFAFSFTMARSCDPCPSCHHAAVGRQVPRQSVPVVLVGGEAVQEENGLPFAALEVEDLVIVHLERGGFQRRQPSLHLDRHR